MSRFPFLDRHLPSVAPYLSWWLDGLSLGAQASGPGRAKRLSADALKKPPRGMAALQVPAGDWLTLSLSLPPVARAEQERIIALEIADRTPFGRDALHIDWTANGKVHLVRRTAISAQLDTVQSRGGRVRWLVNQNDPNAWIDLAPVDRKPLRAAALLTGVCAVALAALAAYVIYDVQQLRDMRNSTQTQVQITRLDAAEMRKITREIETLRLAQSQQLPDALLPDRPPASALLERLSAATPDHSYLTGLEIGEDGAVLSGWSTAPEGLMRALEMDDGFQNLQFRGPVVADEEGFRFEIRLDWEKPA